MADGLNNFFKETPLSLQNKLPKPNNEFGLKIEYNPNHLNSFEPITVNEIVLEICHLKNNSSLAEVPVKFLKMCATMVAEILCPLFNECIKQGIYPDILKLATVIPIPKGGDKTSMSNYRPISLLSTINKIFEKLLFSRICCFLYKHNIFSSNQFGYLENRSTAQASLKLISHALPAIQIGNFSIIIMIDFSKAFDCVSHKLLLAKLHRYGFRDQVLRLMASYLSCRKQRVRVGDFATGVALSDYIDIGVGVPQGSCLGPLLYIIYSNDLDNLLKEINTVTFADDVALCINGENLQQLITIVNGELDLILNWSYFNLLPINFSKCHALIITNKRILPATVIDIRLGSKTLPIEHKTKYLGIFIDSRLMFLTHLDYVNTKLAQFCGITYHATYKFNVGAALSYYFSFVYSLLSYGVAVWGGVLMTHQCSRTHSLFKRVVLNLFSWHFPGLEFESLCIKLELLMPLDIYKLNVMTLYYNMKHNGYLPIIQIEKYRSLYGNRHNYDLRVPFPRTNAGTLCLPY